MKSTARFMDHPIHPMIIPFPFAFLSGAVAFDVAAAAAGSERLASTARHLSVAGIATALAAAVPGLIDYVATVPAGRARQMATVHMLSNVSALGLFAAAAKARPSSRRPTATVLALELIGTAILSVGGWLGGSLVYHHQIGVDPEERDGAGRLGAATGSVPVRREA